MSVLSSKHQCQRTSGNLQKHWPQLPDTILYASNTGKCKVVLAATLWWFTAAPKPLKIQVFWGSPSPQGSYSPYILGDTTRLGRVTSLTCVLVWSKSDRRRLRKTLHKQTNRQTNRHYENNGHLAVNQYFLEPGAMAHTHRLNDHFWNVPSSCVAHLILGCDWCRPGREVTQSSSSFLHAYTHFSPGIERVQACTR